MSSPSDAPLSPSASAAAIAKAIKHKGEHEYPKDTLYFVFSFVAVGIIINAYSIVWAFWRRHRPAKAEACTSKNVVVRLFAAGLTAIRIFAFRWRLPAINLYLLEILLSCLYLLALLLWTFCNTEDLTIKEYSDRTGHIAAAQLPVIVALSMKNNIIGWVTGIGHEKLKAMHRAVARVLLVEVWIHGWTRVNINAPTIAQVGWKREGLVAGLIYTLLVVVSVAPVRKRWYEAFFIIHTVMAFALIVIVFLHTRGAGNFEYYIWPCFVIWGFDRGCRWLRYIILTNFKSPNQSPAVIELLNHDTVRISVERYVPFGWRAGQHMFLAFPTVGPIESHPFTISNIPAADEKSKKLIWIVRARDGFTKRLREYAELKGGQATAPVFMDGPYGAPADITPFSTCVFIAGGSGVTYTLPRLRELLLKAAAKHACARRIVFVWAVRHASHIAWVADELRAAAASVPSDVVLSLMVFVTAPSSPTGTLDDSASMISDPEKDAYDEKAEAAPRIRGLQIAAGRPDVQKILQDAVTTSGGPVSVDVSGPNPLVAGVRKALSHGFASPLSVLRGTPTVQLNVENFTM